ncbi:MAG: hypothetical protein ACE5NA_09250 [Nitrospiraceae bacterium]
MVCIFIALPPFANAADKGACKFGSHVHSWRVADYAVYACSYGVEPREIKPGGWKASGIAFYRLATSGTELHPQLIKKSSEAEPDIEYSFRDGVLSFVVYTYDPRPNGHVPFVRESFDLSEEDLKPKIEILLKPPPRDDAKVDELFRILAMPKRGAMELFRDCEPVGECITRILYELRNYGLRDPQDVLGWLEAIGAPWWRDGYSALTLKQVKEELVLVQKAQQSTGFTRAPTHFVSMESYRKGAGYIIAERSIDLDGDGDLDHFVVHTDAEQVWANLLLTQPNGLLLVSLPDGGEYELVDLGGLYEIRVGIPTFPAVGSLEGSDRYPWYDFYGVVGDSLELRNWDHWDTYQRMIPLYRQRIAELETEIRSLRRDGTEESIAEVLIGIRQAQIRRYDEFMERALAIIQSKQGP